MRVMRPSVDFARSYFQGKNPVCMEVGVQEGGNAKSIMEALNPAKIYLIDPWISYDWNNIGQGDCFRNEQFYDLLKDEYKNDDKIFLLRGLSKNILPALEQDSFDFIYIDGNHEPDFVKEDILNCLKLMKVGGILAGHDYLSNGQSGIVSFSGNEGGVVNAVHNVFNGKYVYAAPGDWWVIINEEHKELSR